MGQLGLFSILILVSIIVIVIVPGSWVLGPGTWVLLVHGTVATVLSVVLGRYS